MWRTKSYCFSYTLLAAPMPGAFRTSERVKKFGLPRGVAGRRAALDWIINNTRCERDKCHVTCHVQLFYPSKWTEWPWFYVITDPIPLVLCTLPTTTTLMTRDSSLRSEPQREFPCSLLDCWGRQDLGSVRKVHQQLSIPASIKGDFACWKKKD